MRNFTKLMLIGTMLFVCLGGVKANRYLVYNNGTAGVNTWDRQAICLLNSAMTIDQQYIIKAKIKAESGDGLIDMGINITDDAPYPDTKADYPASIKPTTEFVEYVWYYTPTTFAPTRIVFNTGLFAGKVYLDDVTCVPNGGSGDLVANGNFNVSDISNWTKNYQGPSYTRWDYEESISISDACFTTFSHKKNISVDGDVVKAYKAKYEGGKVVLTSVTEIPAGQGVIIEAVEGPHTVSAINSASALDGNELLVSDGSVTSDGTHYFALGKKVDKVGFMKVANGVTIPKGKAYLYIAIPPKSRDFIGFDDETTGIESVKQQAKADNQYFNIAGQRVAQPTKGLYIVNGKKVIIK